MRIEHILRPALLLASFAIALSVVGAVIFTEACGGGSSGPGGPTTTIKIPTGTVQAIGDLELKTEKVGIGDTVELTGTGWTGNGTVVFILVTKQQWDLNQALQADQVVSLGEAQPETDGAVTFNFDLQASYSRLDGTELLVAPGQQLYLKARQGTTAGSQGAGVGPLNITERS